MPRPSSDSHSATSEQLRVVAALSEDYGNSVADITVRQNIQLHWVQIQSLPSIFERLAAVGLSTTGACGDVTRNITGCPLAGVGRIHLVATENGQRLFSEELGITSGDLKKLPARILGRPAKKIEILSNRDVGASIASGSYHVNAMIVIPCTMGALATTPCSSAEMCARP